MMMIQYKVIGMTCGGCLTKIKTFLLDQADEVSITLDPPIATLTNPKQNLTTLNALLSNIGAYKLIEANPISLTNQSASEPTVEKRQSWLSTYFPLLLIIAFISSIAALVQFTPTNFALPFSFTAWMTHFMAGFFLVFAFFKLLDIKGFAASYAMYDLLAMRVKVYGFIYPFIELGLGVFYLLEWNPIMTNSITLVVMLFSSIGVIRSVMNKQNIRCACLGSVFNLPMSTVTIIEDLAMAGMAFMMLI